MLVQATMSSLEEMVLTTSFSEAGNDQIEGQENVSASESLSGGPREDHQRRRGNDVINGDDGDDKLLAAEGHR
jgi:hypothetical protein